MYISLPLLTDFLIFLLSLYLLTLVSYQNSKLYLRRKCHAERRTTPKSNSNRMLCLSVPFFHSILVERNTFSIVLFFGIYKLFCNRNYRYQQSCRFGKAAVRFRNYVLTIPQSGKLLTSSVICSNDCVILRKNLFRNKKICK